MGTCHRLSVVAKRERYRRVRALPVATLGQGATIHHGFHAALFSFGSVWRVAAYQSKV
jgi:hypothetical protein